MLRHSLNTVFGWHSHRLHKGDANGDLLSEVIFMQDLADLCCRCYPAATAPELSFFWSCHLSACTHEVLQGKSWGSFALGNFPCLSVLGPMSRMDALGSPGGVWGMPAHQGGLQGPGSPSLSAPGGPQQCIVPR